jgi:hypothetical protein
MKSIVFTIKVGNEQSSFFMTVLSEPSTELQIHNALAEICFCDSYEIESYEEVDSDYVSERSKLFRKYEQHFGQKVDDSFCSGRYTTKEAIEKEMEWLVSETTS